jgi:tRNA (guanine37-N1)-methyltransferase
MGMRVDIVTLFPEMCQRVLDESILGRAAKRGYIETHCHQIRDYTLNRQKQTDDYPYGGGCGMVLYAQPIADCLRAVLAQNEAQGRGRPHIVFMTAGGARYNEEHAKRLAQYDNLTLVCGHYEGIDERVIEAFADEELSIGDYILTGGELASLVVADSVLRLQPGVLAEQRGYEDESYWNGLLEYPQYTRPEVWEGREVPPVLRSGNHKAVDDWRGEQSRERTKLRRPDLWESYLAAGGWDGTPLPKKPSRHRRKKTAEEQEIQQDAGNTGSVDRPEEEAR